MVVGFTSNGHSDTKVAVFSIFDAQQHDPGSSGLYLDFVCAGYTVKTSILAGRQDCM